MNAWEKLTHWVFAWLCDRAVLSRAPDFIVGADAEGGPYLRRWWLSPRNRLFNIYLHHFLRDDDDRAAILPLGGGGERSGTGGDLNMSGEPSSPAESTAPSPGGMAPRGGGGGLGGFSSSGSAGTVPGGGGGGGDSPSPNAGGAGGAGMVYVRWGF